MDIFNRFVEPGEDLSKSSTQPKPLGIGNNMLFLNQYAPLSSKASGTPIFGLSGGVQQMSSPPSNSRSSVENEEAPNSAGPYTYQPSESDSRNATFGGSNNSHQVLTRARFFPSKVKKTPEYVTIDSDSDEEAEGPNQAISGQTTSSTTDPTSGTNRSRDDHPVPAHPIVVDLEKEVVDTYQAPGSSTSTPSYESSGNANNRGDNHQFRSFQIRPVAAKAHPIVVDLEEEEEEYSNNTQTPSSSTPTYTPTSHRLQNNQSLDNQQYGPAVPDVWICKNSDKEEEKRNSRHRHTPSKSTWKSHRSKDRRSDKKHHRRRGSKSKKSPAWDYESDKSSDEEEDETYYDRRDSTTSGRDKAHKNRHRRRSFSGKHPVASDDVMDLVDEEATTNRQNPSSSTTVSYNLKSNQSQDNHQYGPAVPEDFVRENSADEEEERSYRHRSGQTTPTSKSHRSKDRLSGDKYYRRHKSKQRAARAYQSGRSSDDEEEETSFDGTEATIFASTYGSDKHHNKYQRSRRSSRNEPVDTDYRNGHNLEKEKDASSHYSTHTSKSPNHPSGSDESRGNHHRRWTNSRIVHNLDEEDTRLQYSHAPSTSKSPNTTSAASNYQSDETLDDVTYRNSSPNRRSENDKSRNNHHRRGTNLSENTEAPAYRSSKNYVEREAENYYQGYNSNLCNPTDSTSVAYNHYDGRHCSSTDSDDSTLNRSDAPIMDSDYRFISQKTATIVAEAESTTTSFLDSIPLPSSEIYQAPSSPAVPQYSSDSFLDLIPLPSSPRYSDSYAQTVPVPTASFYESRSFSSSTTTLGPYAQTAPEPIAPFYGSSALSRSIATLAPYAQTIPVHSFYGSRPLPSSTATLQTIQSAPEPTPMVIASSPGYSPIPSTQNYLDIAPTISKAVNTFFDTSPLQTASKSFSPDQNDSYFEANEASPADNSRKRASLGESNPQPKRPRRSDYSCSVSKLRERTKELVDKMDKKGWSLEMFEKWGDRFLVNKLTKPKEPWNFGVPNFDRRPNTDSNARYGVRYNTEIANAAQFAVKNAVERAFQSMENLEKKVEEYFENEREPIERLKEKVKLWKKLEKKVGIELTVAGSTFNGTATKSSDLNFYGHGVHYSNGVRIEDFDQTYKEFWFELLMPVLAKIDGCEKSSLHHPSELTLKLNYRPNNVKLQFDVDFNLNNFAGLRHSYLVHCHSLIDRRFSALLMYVRDWSRRENLLGDEGAPIPTSKLEMMVIHFLQSGITPCILPNLHFLFPHIFDEHNQKSKDIWLTDRGLHYDNMVWFSDFTESLTEMRRKNEQSISELIVGFFKYFSKVDLRKFQISESGRLVEKQTVSENEESGRMLRRALEKQSGIFEEREF